MNERVFKIPHHSSLEWWLCGFVPNLIASSISGKHDFPAKVTTHVQLPVTSQSNCIVIFVENGIGDPRNRVFQKYSPRLNCSTAVGVGTWDLGVQDSGFTVHGVRSFCVEG